MLLFSAAGLKFLVSGLFVSFVEIFALAFPTELLKAAQPVDEGQPPSRKAILEAASRVGEASHELLRYATANQDAAFYEEVDQDRAYQDALLSLAKAVANATASLVLKAKQVASVTEDPGAQQKVIASATATGLATSQLVACTKVVAPSVQHEPDCQMQLTGERETFF